MDGHVYFVQGRSSGLIKIGSSTDMRSRLSALRSQNPDPLDFLGTIATPTPKGTEKALHTRFAKLQAHGEWFRADAPLLKYIAENATPPADSVWQEVTLRQLYGMEKMLQHQATWVNGEVVCP